MAIGERIHFFRTLRGMTQKYLGMALGFPEKSADVRLAQYENGSRTPKADLTAALAQILDVSPHALDVPVYILDDRIKYTTNHKKLSQIFNSTDSVDVAAVESLLAKIQDDYEKGMFEQNSGQYLTFYKSMKEWLEIEAEE